MSALNPKVQALRSQLQQLQSQHEAGTLGDDAYRQGREALERKIIDTVVQAPAASAVHPAAATTPSSAPSSAPSSTPNSMPCPAPSQIARQAGLVLAALAVAAGSVWWFNRAEPEVAAASPPLAVHPAALAGAASAPHALGEGEVAAMTERLAARLKTQPDDAKGWAMLGRSYAVLGRPDDALAAYERLLQLRPKDADAMADYADALALKAGRKFDGEPAKWIAKSLAINPDNLKALALAGTEAFNRGDYAAAVRHWDRAVTVGPAGHPMVHQASEGAAEARRLGKLPAAASAAGP